MTIKRYDSKYNFMSAFNQETGQYVRSGIIQNGKDTGADPFMASFPELLDVGIMGSCTHGQSGLCLQAGIQCYQNGRYSNKPNMTLENYESIMKQCKNKVFQFALGGCGDPDQHGNFREILEMTRMYDIVPNFTTSGLGMTKEKAIFCKEYCGAVAVSQYARLKEIETEASRLIRIEETNEYTANAIKLLIDAGVKTNIHYVLNNDTLKEAIFRLKYCIFPKGINAVVFLLHKPIGLGTEDNMIKTGNPLWDKFVKLVNSTDFPFKIGFDSCTVPALINNMGNIDGNSLDTCEAARWSAYITPDMKMLPCSFDNQGQKWAVDLKTHTIQEAWDSEVFEDFRNSFRSACPNCDKRELCLGGCPICPGIVLCNQKERILR